jgi:hypothetical protein
MRHFFIILLAAILVPVVAKADMNKQFIQDGTTLQEVQQQLANKVGGRDLVIKSYSKAWNAYNPMSWIIDPDRKYRSITFEFVNNGKKQTIDCDVSIKKGSENLLAYNCSGGDQSFRYYTKLNKYGYAEDSVIIENVIHNSSTESNQGTKSAK